MTSYIILRDHLGEMTISILAKKIKSVDVCKNQGLFLSFSELWGLIFTESSPSEAGELCQSVVTS